MAKPFLKKILVAVNGTQSSIQAAMYGIVMAKNYQLKMKVVFVVDTATIKYLENARFLVSDERRSYEEDLKRDGKNYLDYIENLARTKGVKIETELKDGSVASEVIASCDAFEADLLLVGGHNEASSTLHSSHASRSSVISARNDIVAYSHCPVLVVHKRDIEDLFKIS